MRPPLGLSRAATPVKRSHPAPANQAYQANVPNDPPRMLQPDPCPCLRAGPCDPCNGSTAANDPGAQAIPHIGPSEACSEHGEGGSVRLIEAEARCVNSKGIKHLVLYAADPGVV